LRVIVRIILSYSFIFLFTTNIFAFSIFDCSLATKNIENISSANQKICDLCAGYNYLLEITNDITEKFIISSKKENGEDKFFILGENNVTGLEFESGIWRLTVGNIIFLVSFGGNACYIVTENGEITNAYFSICKLNRI